jgi:hypothetical protein
LTLTKSRRAHFLHPTCQENLMTTHPLVPDPLTDRDGPPILEPDYNEPIEDPDSGALPEDEPEDELPEEDHDDEPLPYEEDEALGEPSGESDAEMDDEIFREQPAVAGARPARSN